MNVPCMGCAKRTATCHGECSEYRDYKAQVAKIRALRDVDRNYISAENERRRDCRRRRETFRPT